MASRGGYQGDFCAKLIGYADLIKTGGSAVLYEFGFTVKRVALTRVQIAYLADGGDRNAVGIKVGRYSKHKIGQRIHNTAHRVTHGVHMAIGQLQRALGIVFADGFYNNSRCIGGITVVFEKFSCTNEIGHFYLPSKVVCSYFITNFFNIQFKNPNFSSLW